MLNSNSNIDFPMFSADIDETQICEFSKDILELLLTDKTTKRNIIWATNDYKLYGESYDEHFPITVDQITKENVGIIQPRILKEKSRQISRRKDKAEVFTPASVCNNQLNLIDDAWFGRKNVFNLGSTSGWKPFEGKIEFSEQKPYRWQDYVDLKRLEITCGEAPYITSRYDMQSGEFIPVSNRIGMLDRKLRVVSENTSTFEEWVKWATRSVESIYGFEFQGDSLVIARENIMFAFVESMNEKFSRTPDEKLLRKIANVIAWNIWQMDAFTYSVPYQKVIEQFHQNSLFEENSATVLCKIKDWRSKVTLTYTELFKETK